MPKENNSTKPTQHFVTPPESHFLQLAVWALVFVTVLPLEARAYTDPGTGTFLLQMLLAAIASSLFFMRTLRRRIRLLFRRNRKIGATEDGDSDKQSVE